MALTDEQIEKLADKYLVGLYQNMEKDVLQDIARRVRKTGRLTETAEIMARNMHEQGCCVFDFRSPELDGNSLASGARKVPEGHVNRFDMTWHTADVYQIFKKVCKNVCPKAADVVREVLRNKLGDEAFEFLEKLSEEDHDSIDQTC